MAHESDQSPIDQNPQYILSGPCHSCGKVFRHIKKHLAKSPLCAKDYDLTILNEACKESVRLQKLKYHQDNRIKVNQQLRDNYRSKCEIKKQQKREYAIKNRKISYEVQKMKRRGDI